MLMDWKVLLHEQRQTNLPVNVPGLYAIKYFLDYKVIIQFTTEEMSGKQKSQHNFGCVYLLVCLLRQVVATFV